MTRGAAWVVEAEIKERTMEAPTLSKAGRRFDSTKIGSDRFHNANITEPVARSVRKP